MRNGLKLVKMIKRGTMLGALEDEPWTWTHAWNSDMPEFFNSPEIKEPNDVYHNVFDCASYSLDDSPVSWHITEPVDPTEYQGEYIGGVINIY